MKQTPPTIEIVTLQLDAEQAEAIWSACEAFGVPKTGEGLVMVFLDLLDGHEPEEVEEKASRQRGEKLGEAVVDFLSNENNRKMMLDIGGALLRKVRKP